MNATESTYSIIGMSPGNSYFKDDTVEFLLREVTGRFGRAAVLIPDVPAISTYLALGYSAAEARNKAIPKGNNLRNRVKRIMSKLGLATEEVRIIDWQQEVVGVEAYTQQYSEIQDLYDTNNDFREAANKATKAVLLGYSKEITDIQASIQQGVKYLLAELAFMEYAPRLLGAERVTYVYHKPWPVYEDLIAGVFDGKRRGHLGFLLFRKPSTPEENRQPVIHVVTDKATPQQLEEIAAFYVMHIKVAVDIERGILAGGGEWHADCEKVLIQQGSKQKNIWGGGYRPETKEVDFYSLINIRPKQGNPDQAILSQEIRGTFEKIVRKRLEI